MTDTNDAVEGLNTVGVATLAIANTIRKRHNLPPLTDLTTIDPSLVDELNEQAQAALSHTNTSEGVEVRQIVSFIREQSAVGAEKGIESKKGSTRRSAYGGGSLALTRIADAIERGEHLTSPPTPDTTHNAELVGELEGHIAAAAAYADGMPHLAENAIEELAGFVGDNSDTILTALRTPDSDLLRECSRWLRASAKTDHVAQQRKKLANRIDARLSPAQKGGA